MAFRLFGLTGGIASGKSTVGRMFRELGCPLIDADLVAREVVEPGSAGLAEVVAAFGEEVLLPDGSLDRAALGRRVFGDPAERRKLNAILHPKIGARTAERAAALAAAGEQIACYEAALLVENGIADMFRPLVVVVVPEAVQIARVIARDALSEAEARERVAAQLPLSKKVAVADHVIDNSGDPESTRARVREIWAKLTA